MKKLTAFLILGALTISLTELPAQETGRPTPRGPVRGKSSVTARSADNAREQWSAIQSQLKKEFPKEYAEIETLQKTNLFAAFEKLQALARKADLQTPAPFSSTSPRERRRTGGRERGGHGFPGGRRREGGAFRPRGDTRTAIETKLKTDFATEYAEISKLRIEAENKLEALAKKAKLVLPEDWNSYQLKIEALRLSGKYRSEFEKIDELQKKGDFRTVFAEIGRLAEKEGIKPPAFGPRGGRQGRGGADDAPQPRRANPLQKLREIRRKYPEEVQKLDAIRRDDPRAYREGLRKLIERFDAEQKGK